MSRVPDFKKFVIEEKDEDSELRSMGFPPDEPFYIRMDKLYDSFLDDEEVIAAINLKNLDNTQKENKAQMVANLR